MKRYALFAGKHRYPAGGWDDFRGSFDTPEEAWDHYDTIDHEWGHVVDLTNGVVIPINLAARHA